MGQATKKTKQPTKEEITKKDTIEITLIQLVDSYHPLRSFNMQIPKPIFYAMDLTVAIKNQITPQFEGYYDTMKSLAKSCGVSELGETIQMEDFPSSEKANEFFTQLKELQNKKVSLKLKTISFAEIRQYIEKSGIDANAILIGDELLRLDWLITS